MEKGKEMEGKMDEIQDRIKEQMTKESKEGRIDEIED